MVESLRLRLARFSQKRSHCCSAQCPRRAETAKPTHRAWNSDASCTPSRNRPGGRLPCARREAIGRKRVPRLGRRHSRPTAAAGGEHSRCPRTRSTRQCRRRARERNSGPHAPRVGRECPADNICASAGVHVTHPTERSAIARFGSRAGRAAGSATELSARRLDPLLA